MGEIRVGARARSYNNIAQFKSGGYAAGGADADNIIDIVEIEKLIGIYAYRGHAHAGRHDGDGLSVISSGIALNAPDIVYEAGVVEKSFGDIFRPERIAGHEDCFGEIAFVCGVMCS